MKTVLLCGKQGFALRGSNDDGVLGDNIHSNFENLLKFKIDAWDEVLKNHLGNCKPNAKYVSKTTQNNIVNIIDEQIRDNIFEKSKASTIFLSVCRRGH